MTDTVTPDTVTTDLEAQIGAYADNLVITGLHALEAVTISLGRTLGLYDRLVELGEATPADLAGAAGIHPRYAQEWLEQQAAAGFIDVVADGLDGAGASRTYALSTAAAACLTDPDSLASVGPLFDLLPSVGTVLPALHTAFRTGGGVPYADYAIHDAQGDFNRPAFLNLLTSEWLPAVPGLAARLERGDARVAEIGCGEGWAAIAIAKAWPGVRVDGFDLDDASIAAARRHAADAGVADRVRFELVDVTGDLSDRAALGSYDLVLAFEMVHDLARPVDALRNMRALAKEGAVIVVMDENVAEAFEAATENPIERLFYAASVLHCLPVGMADAPSAGTGTVMRPSTFRRYATEAGFAGVDILPIEHPMFRFYGLR
jgi:2-polyprenyl-3-methyl-5-hydroxy-6-metoxy-1,4-benzoquinol methylase